MRFRVELQDQEVVSPVVWAQVKRAVHQLGLAYGLAIDFPGDIATCDEVERRWWEAKGSAQEPKE